MRIRRPGIGIGIARHQVRFGGGRCCSQPKSAIDMQPSNGGFRFGDDLERGIECPGIHLPGLQADDGGTGEVGKHISTHTALLVHRNAHHTGAAKARQSQRLEQRDMGFLLLLRYKNEARQAPFTGKRLDDGQNALCLLELSFPFDLEQLTPAPGAGLIPSLWHHGVIFCDIPLVYQRKARFLDQPFILTEWGKEKVPDGTADRYLLVGENAGDRDRVGEEDASTRT